MKYLAEDQYGDFHQGESLSEILDELSDNDRDPDQCSYYRVQKIEVEYTRTLTEKKDAPRK